MAGNIFDQFDQPAAGGNIFDQFDAPAPPSPKKKQVGFFEGFGRRAMDAMAAVPETAAAVVGLAPAAIDKVAGTDLYDAYARNVIAPNTRAREFWQPDRATEELTGAGQVGNALGALPRDLAAAIITGGAAPAQQAVAAAPGIAAATKAALPFFAQGAKVMTVPAVIEGRDQFNRARAGGATPTQAALSSLNTSANTLVGGALPLSTPGRLATRAAVGGAAGVTQAAEQQAVDNIVLPQNMRQELSWQDMATSGGIAAVMAALLGPRASAPLPNPSVMRDMEPPNPLDGIAPADLERFGPILEANNITEPDSIARAVGNLLAREQRVADQQAAGIPQNKPVRTAGADEQIDAVRAGDIDPATLPTAGRVQQPVPDVIAVDSQGRAGGPGVDGVKAGMLSAEGERAKGEKSATQAFDIADARQRRADADLAQRGELAPDYQGGLAAATGGRMDSGTRRITLLDGAEPVEIVGLGEDGSVTVRLNDDAGTVETIGPKQVERRLSDIDIPVNQRLAQDFVARSSEPRRGVGVETMEGENMPRRSTDRIAGDQVGGRASMVDPVTRDGGSPPATVLPPEPEGQRGLPPGRVGDVIDGQVVREPGTSVVPAGPARGPTIDTPDPRRQVGMNERAPGLPSPDAEEPGGRPSGRIIADGQGNARQEAETPRQRQDREAGERRQQSVDDYSRNDLGNTARNVGRTDTSTLPRREPEPAPRPDRAADQAAIKALEQQARRLATTLARENLKPETRQRTQSQLDALRNNIQTLRSRSGDFPIARTGEEGQARRAEEPEPARAEPEPINQNPIKAETPAQQPDGQAARPPDQEAPREQPVARDTAPAVRDDPKPAKPKKARKIPADGIPKTRDLRRQLKDAGGIDVREASDLGFENAAVANRMYPGLFRRGGMSMDGVVEWMQESGWLYRHDIEKADADGVGGSHELARDLIYDWLQTKGNGPTHPEDIDIEMEAKRAWEQQKYEQDVAAGLIDEIPDADASIVELAAKAREADPDAFEDIPTGKLEGDDLYREALQEIVDNAKAKESADRGGDQGSDAEGRGEGEGAQAAADEGVQGADAPEAGAGRPEPDQPGGGRVDEEPLLQGQTAAEIRQQEAQRVASERAAAEAARAAENKTRADSEVAGFELTGDGIDPRIGDMFGNSPITEAAKPAIMAAADVGEKLNNPMGKGPGGRLNSGIPIDEIARLLKQAADSLGVTKGMQELMKDVRQLTTGGPDTPKSREMVLPHLLRTVLASTQGHMRALEKITGSTAMTKIRQHFDAAPGRGEGVGETFGEAIQRESNKLRNSLFDALAPFLDDTPEAAAQRQQITKLVQSRGSIRKGTPIHDAAAKIGAMLDDAIKYMKDAGVEVESARNYFPRMIDNMAVMRDPAGFMAAAKSAYRAAGMPEAEAQAAAQAWQTAIIQSQHGIAENPFAAVSNSVPTANMAQHRQMPKSAEEILRKFYVQDPLDALQLYIHKAVRRAEWERRFGGEVEYKDQNGNTKTGTKMDALQAQLNAEGHQAVIPTMQNLVQAATGEVPNAVGTRARTAVSWAHALTVIQFLRHATITSMTEPILTGARTGNYADMARGYLYSLQDIQNRAADYLKQDWLQNKTAREARQIAEMLGYLETDLAASVHTVLQVDGMVDASKVASKLAHRATLYSGLRQWTDATRSASLRVGMQFLNALADDVAEGVRPNLTKQHLLDLGIPSDQHAAFSKWVQKGSNIKDGSAMAATYQKALGRFINQVIMAPTNADKPRYANHPVGSVAYSLTSYIYSFQNNVLNRMGRMFKQAVDPRSEFNGSERVRLLAPLLAIPMAAIAQYGLGYARDAAFGDEEKIAKKDKEVSFRAGGVEVPQRVTEAISRSGMFGAADPWINLVTSAKYERDPTTILVGPVGANWQKLVMDGSKMFTSRNSPNTPTHERQMMKDVYNTMIDPAVTLAALYLPAPAAVAVTQTMARQDVREGFSRKAGDALHSATGL